LNDFSPLGRSHSTIAETPAQDFHQRRREEQKSISFSAYGEDLVFGDQFKLKRIFVTSITKGAGVAFDSSIVVTDGGEARFPLNRQGRKKLKVRPPEGWEMYRGDFRTQTCRTRCFAPNNGPRNIARFVGVTASDEKSHHCGLGAKSIYF
jgi:hypothetical protein